MELYGNITDSLSVPRIALGLLTAGGVAVIAYAFTHYGLPAGAAVSMLPIGLCALWFSLRNPAVSMLGMLVLNYFIMYLGREFLHGVPVGLILDGALFFNLAILLLQALVHQIEWRRAGTGLTLAAAIWMVYCVLELFNPQSVSPKG